MSGNKKEIDFSKEGYNQFINQVIRNIQEERELALDRYRTQDEQMQEKEDFVVMGKNAASFLNIASNRTDALYEIAKQVRDIIYKSEEEGEGEISEEERKAIEKEVMGLKNKEEEQQEEAEIKGDEVDEEDEENFKENNE